VGKLTLAQDYLRLKDGRLIRGAIVRTDSATIFLANWDERHLPLPQLQVFTKREIQSISFYHPPQVELRGAYRPHERGYEFGGGITFQSMKEEDHLRRLFQLTLLGGYTIFPVMGIEAEGDFTFPQAARDDTLWHSYRGAYQVAANLLLHPWTFHGFTPFALIGGGTALAIPIDHVLLTTSNDQRSLLNLGIGCKWGQDGVGCRMEYRYELYSWTPDKSIDEVRVAPQEAFCHLVRVGLFFYR
jgi:hypothetical protein